MLEKDSSEVVREQVRIVIEEEARARYETRKESAPTAESRHKLWGFPSPASYLKKQKLKLLALLSILLGVIAGWWTRSTCLQRSTIDTLVQANATVFALVITIPLAAVQFSRYKVDSKSFLEDKWNLAFLAVYGTTVFLPVLFYEASLSPLFIGLSTMCITLMFPFLFRVTYSLRTTSIIDQIRREIKEKWKKGQLVDCLEFEYLAYQAIEIKDYRALKKVVSSLVDLFPSWLQTKAKFSYDVLLPDEPAFTSVLARIGEASLSHPFALRIYCDEILWIRTYARFDVDTKGFAAKMFEFNRLVALTKSLPLSERRLRIILIRLIKWCVQNRYSEKDLETKAIGWCAWMLCRQNKLASDIVERIKSQIGYAPSPTEVSESIEYAIMWSFLDIVKYNTLRVISRLELEIYKRILSREIESCVRAPRISFDDAKTTDARSIIALQKVVHEREADACDDYLILPLSETPEQVAEEMKRKRFVIARANGTIIGSVRGELEEKTCRIGRLMVHPGFLGIGIEGELVNRIESYFSNAAVFQVVAYHKSLSVDFYKKLGYQVSMEEKLSDKITMLYLEKKASSRP